MSMTKEQAKNLKINLPSIQYCKYCNKECKNLNSLIQHEIRCKENPNRKAYDNFPNYIREHRKGKTKDNCDDVKKQMQTMKMKYENGYVSPMKGKPGTWLGRHHTEESKRKIGESVSKSRKLGYADGSITPAEGVGRGKYSYIIHDGKKYMLRSTYEFIYALYLIHNNIKFELESIRVPASIKNEFSETFLSDFYLPDENLIVETKGIKSDKDFYIKESFIYSGYNFKELYEEDIEKIKESLKENYNIDYMLDRIKIGHDNKDYFVYEI